MLNNQYPERVGLFVDAANLYHTAMSLGFRVDFNRFLAYFKKRGTFLGYAGYYTAVEEMPDGDRPLQRLLDYLSDNGWLLVTKPAKSWPQVDGVRRVKGNMDVELTCDALEMANHVDHIILVSGDGDFSYLVERILKKGRRVSIVSSRRSNMLAGDLRRAATVLIDLAEIRDEICERLPV